MSVLLPACVFIFYQFLEMKSKMLSLTFVLTQRDTKQLRNRAAVGRHCLRKSLSWTSELPLHLESDVFTGRDCLHQAGGRRRNRTAEPGAIQDWSHHSQFQRLSPRARQVLCLVRAFSHPLDICPHTKDIKRMTATQALS